MFEVNTLIDIILTHYYKAILLECEDECDYEKQIAGRFQVESWVKITLLIITHYLSAVLLGRAGEFEINEHILRLLLEMDEGSHA